MSHNEYSTTGFALLLRRRRMRYLVSWFTPTGLLVLISWISFFIPPELVPGRMALLVTIFLMLVNIDNTGNAENPKAEGLTGMELWLVTCMAFVAMALFEYAIMLHCRFGRRGNDEKKAESPELRKWLAKCDRHAAVVFAVAFALFNLYFWIKVHSY